MQSFKNICIILSNFLLKVHEKYTRKPLEKADWTNERKAVADLIMSVLLGKLCVREALLKFPKNCNDKSVEVAWHALMHFEADEDISKNDNVFLSVQIDLLEDIHNILVEGNELPANLIAGYNKYHKGVDTTRMEGREYFWHEMRKNLNIQE